MQHTLSIAAMSLAFGLGAFAFHPNSAANVQQPSQAQKTEADEAFAALSRDFNNLHRSLRNKGGITENDRGVIRSMRERVVALSRQYPNDVRGPAMELMLAKWLKDDERAEALHRRIIQIDPSNVAARFSFAKWLRAENRYPEAIEVLQLYPFDPAQHPEETLLLADCLFAEHQFQQSLDAIDSIPSDAFPPDTPVQTQRERQREIAAEYVSLWTHEQSIRHSEEAADDLPRVMLVTARGSILLELFENEAPNTVANFVSLSDAGFYNGTKFHRVIENFMAQGGDPNTKPGAEGMPGLGGPGYTIPDEHHREDRRNHFTGSLSMAKTNEPNSGGSQFFITVTPTPHLNGEHTVFGRVLEGLEVARALRSDDVLEMVTVLRRRPHEYRPTTLANQAQSAPAKHKGIPDQPATDDAPREEAPPQPEPSADRNDDPHE